ncbi:MAG: T9SS type A sorting domain-containing protein, partial [Bacteroidales bacterium]|nr:T9SS type A sorting domain-containing protein [Bacteroidales bacterium]
TTANGVASRGLRAYNNFYSTTNVAYVSAAKTTVAALQSATGQDSSTISVMPVFQNIAKELKPTNDNSFKCPNDYALIQTDIDGNPRSSVTVMGAYHTLSSNLPANDAMLAGFHNLNKIFAGKSPVFIIIYNNGTTEIKQANLSCTINGVSQTGLYYQPKQPLAPQKYDTVEIGKYNFPMGACTLKVWVEMTGDANRGNDTISTQLKVIAKEDVALLDFANTYLDGGQQSNIYVTMFNNGLDTLKSVEIHWKSANVVQTTYYWKGALAAGDTTVVNIGSSTPAARRFIAMSAWTENPNNLIDGNVHNDTIEARMFSCNGPLSGTLTVASSGGARTLFNTIEEAVQALNTCGVNGAVILSIGMPLTLNQLILSDSVPGSSSVNTISLTPDAGLTVTINYGSYGPSLILDNTKHWIFSNFSIGDSVRGLTGIQMKGTNRDIAFYNCSIHASQSATKNESNAIEFINPQKSKDYPQQISFTQCRITGGFANFYLSNTAGDLSQMDKASINIETSTLCKAFAYGIYSEGMGAIKKLSGNTITNRSVCKDYTAVHSENYAVWDKIEQNRIHISNDGAAYGFYFIKGNQDASYTKRTAYMTNNEVKIIGNGSTQCGIYQNEPNGNWEIHHNSIYVQANSKGANANGMELYNSNSKCKVNVSRNLIYADASICYPLVIGTASCAGATYGVREWNNLYSKSNVAYIGSAITTIAQLQSLTMQDANSQQTLPTYTNLTNSLQLTSYFPFRTPAILTMVGKDINSKARIKLTPMGCYTIDMYETANLKFKEVISPKVVDDAVCYSSSVPVTVELENSGMKSVGYDTAALKISVDISGAATLHFDTTFQKGGLKGTSSEIITLGSFQTTTDGVYNVKLTLQCKADDTTSDNEAIITYKVYRIGLPYDVDFTSAPKEMVTRTVSGDAQWTLFGSGNPAPVYGKGILMLGSSSNKGSVAHATFNGIHLDGYTQPKLTFWYAHTNGKNQGDSLIVKASTDGGATFTVLCRLAAAGSTAGWKEYSYDLSKFATDPCLSIVFEGITGGIAQQVDRIRLSALQDASIALLPIDLGERASCDKTPLDIKAVVTNRTMQPITFTNDTIRMQVTGAINASTQYVYSNTLAGMAADTITVGQFVPYAEGNYYLDIFMQSQDDVAANDTLRDSTLSIHRDLKLASCTGIDSTTAHTAGELLPLTAAIANRGNILVDRYFVQVKVNGDATYTDTVYQTLYAGDTTTHIISFQVPFATKENPYYNLSIFVHMDCDADYTNDTIHMVGLVNVPDTTDIQLLDISHSVTSLVGNGSVAPTVRISNNGNSTADQMTLHVVVIDKNNQQLVTLSETVSGLTAGESRNVAFTQKYTVPNYTGTYQLMAYVDALAADPVRSNDTLTKPFECTVGIRNAEKLDWNMGQNIPNPASDVTAIPFNMPQEGRVRFSVMTANGQLIYKQEIQAEAGDNRLELNTGEWASGLYYYSMEYRGQRITRKMNIVR